MTRPPALPHPVLPGLPARQRGISLIELMVGLALGLLVVGVALGALMASRGVSGTVSDATQLQQQASHIFRVMGRQLRQAGSLRLLLASHKPDTTPPENIDIADPVAFEAGAADFNPAQDTVRGNDNPTGELYKLSVGYSNYTEPLHTFAADQSLQRNCLGQTSSSTLIQSHFVLDSSTLRCAGVAGLSGRQPFAENVADFQALYLMQAPQGADRVQYVSASAVGNDWPRVYGVEVCLVLYGAEAIDMPAGSTYTGCDGNSIDLATLAAPRRNRLHMVFRNVYQLRGQGVAG